MSHGSAEHGLHAHAFRTPRLYDLSASILFLGRRRATFQTLIVAAGVRAGQRVLDVGCGTGYLVRLLAEAVGPRGMAVGIDPSPEMLAHARRQARRASNCQFQAGSAQTLDFLDDRFDVVVSSLAMHHVPEDMRLPAVREMLRVLRPGGRVLLAEVQLPRHGLGLRLLGRLHGLDRMARRVPDLEPLLAQAGFTDIRGGEAPPWLRYAQAVKPAQASPGEESVSQPAS